LRPVSLRVRGGSPEYDSAGVSIEGAAPRSGHLGAILYGPAAANLTLFPNGHTLFANIARFDRRWAISEYNATDLKQPAVLPGYDLSYKTFRDLFNYDGHQVSMMAWNGSNGLFAGEPGYVPYTSFRGTPAEEAMKDFLVTHADLPRGARLWTFGSPRHATSDGWSAENGTLDAAPGSVTLHPRAGAIALTSPPDQVIRPSDASLAILGFDRDVPLARVQVFARLDAASPWVGVTAPLKPDALRWTAAGLAVPLAWPQNWRKSQTIVEQLRVELAFAPQADAPRLARIALHPRAN
jgi:hypothetical protein